MILIGSELAFDPKTGYIHGRNEEEGTINPEPFRWQNGFVPDFENPKWERTSFMSWIPLPFYHGPRITNFATARTASILKAYLKAKLTDLQLDIGLGQDEPTEIFVHFLTPRRNIVVSQGPKEVSCNAGELALDLGRGFDLRYFVASLESKGLVSPGTHRTYYGKF